MNVSSHRVRLVLAFGAIYLIWGSTYLAIRFVVETLPPFLMAASRFLTAGLLLLAWARHRGGAWPTAFQWRNAAIVGGLLFLGGNGGVSWAQQRVPSGATSLLIALTPLWIVLFEAARPGGVQPGRRVLAGLALGLSGFALLVGRNPLLGGGGVDGLGATVLFAATLSWAAGSITSRQLEQPHSPLVAAAAQMLAGGVWLLLLGLLAGEPARIHAGAFTPRAMISLAYLTIFGSIIAFTAYLWLLRVTTPARVSTYAYVNPVVAVLIGWGFGGETLTPRVLAASVVIIAGVVVITRGPRPAPAKPT